MPATPAGPLGQAFYTHHVLKYSQQPGKVGSVILPLQMGKLRLREAMRLWKLGRHRAQILT